MGLSAINARLARLALVFVLPLSGYLATLVASHPIATGDEPHYLLFAISLAKDHDINLRNNYANVAELRSIHQFNGLSPDQQAFTYRAHGPLVSMHAPGLPVLLAPVFALGGSYRAARVLMCLLAAAIGPFLLALLDALEPTRRRLNLAVCLIALVCLPMLAYSGQFFPEIPGALLVTITGWVLVTRPSRLGALAVGATAASLLPWFHDRYVLLAGPLVLALLWRAATASADTAAGWRPTALRVGVVAAPVAVSVVGLAVYHLHAYGSLSPNGPYRFGQFQAFTFHFSNLYGNTLSSLFGPVGGALPYAPVFVFALAGMFVFVRRWRWIGLATLVVAAGYFAFVTDIVGDGAYSPAGRFFVILVPVMAVALTAVLARGRLILWLFIPAVAYSLILSGAAIGHFSDLYPRGVDQVYLPVAGRAQKLWPDFPLDLPNQFQLSPALAGRRIGQLQVAANDSGGHAVAAAGDGAGILMFGPYDNLLPGTYRADFPLRATGVPPGTTVGRAEIVQQEKVISTRDIVASDPSAPAAPLTLLFATNGRDLQTRVFFDGTGRLEAATVSVTPAFPASVPPPQPRAGAGLVITWSVIVCVLGLLGLAEAFVHHADESGPADVRPDESATARPVAEDEPAPGAVGASV